MLPMTVDRSSFGIVAICYVLPVLKMTSFAHGPYNYTNIGTVAATLLSCAG